MVTDERAIQDYENELAMLQQQQNQSNIVPYQGSMFGGQPKQNLVEWELDFKPELEDIERLLRCDILSRDENGNEIWIQNPDPSQIFLNNLGVQDVLRKLRLLVNKNKVLSNYTIDEVIARVELIAHELRTLIYNNYEAYGMDNEYKMNNYSIVVLSIMSIIEDAYRRALGGETHKGLAEQRLVTQTEPIMPQGYPQAMQPNQKKSSWYNPLSWGK